MSSPPEMQYKETTLSDILQQVKNLIFYVFRQWKILLAFVLTFGVLVMSYALIRKTDYVSTCTFTAEASSSSGMMSSAMALAGSFGLGSFSSGTISNSFFVGLLESKNIIKSALLHEAMVNGESDLLGNHYIELFGYREDWEDEDLLKDFRFKPGDLLKLTSLEDSLLNLFYEGILSDNLTVLNETELGYVRVELKSKHRDFSVQLCKALVEKAEKFHTEEQTRQARESMALLEKRHDSVFVALLRAEKMLAQIKDSKTRLIKAEGYLDELKATRDVSILNAMYSELTVQVEGARFGILQSKPLINIIDRPEFSTIPKYIEWWLGLIVGLFLGLFLGTGFLVMRKIFSDALEADKAWKESLEQTSGGHA